MTVGELARQTGASIRSLRYYEEMGLLSCRRGANGYRDFGPEASAQVGRIRALLATGFAIADIRVLAPCLDQRMPGAPLCPVALARYRDKLAALDAHIRTVREVRARLVAHIAAEDPAHDHRQPPTRHAPDGEPTRPDGHGRRRPDDPVLVAAAPRAGDGPG